jgi:hypothetical protein
MVRRVSPLLIDLAAFEALSLLHAAKTMRPPLNWPRRPLDDHRVDYQHLTKGRKTWLRELGWRAHGNSSVFVVTQGSFFAPQNILMGGLLWD